MGRWRGKVSERVRRGWREGEEREGMMCSDIYLLEVRQAVPEGPDLQEGKLHQPYFRLHQQKQVWQLQHQHKFPPRTLSSCRWSSTTRMEHLLCSRMYWQA